MLSIGNADIQGNSSDAAIVKLFADRSYDVIFLQNVPEDINLIKSLSDGFGMEHAFAVDQNNGLKLVTFSRSPLASMSSKNANDYTIQHSAILGKYVLANMWFESGDDISVGTALDITEEFAAQSIIGGNFGAATKQTIPDWLNFTCSDSKNNKIGNAILVTDIFSKLDCSNIQSGQVTRQSAQLSESVAAISVIPAIMVGSALLGVIWLALRGD